MHHDRLAAWHHLHRGRQRHELGRLRHRINHLGNHCSKACSASCAGRSSGSAGSYGFAYPCADHFAYPGTNDFADSEANPEANHFAIGLAKRVTFSVA